jgi:GTP-binding protein
VSEAEGGSGEELSGEAIEAGRLLFATPTRYLLSVHHLEDLPALGTVEAAFAGRSNVGKSSLINALTNQHRLAHTSNTPGRTQALNFYVLSDELHLVDMPGYGFAKAPKEKVAAWTTLVRDYLRGRPGLKRVYLLIDARHGLKPNDQEIMDLLDRAAVSYQVVLTKADKLKPGALARVVEETRERLRKRPAAHPVVLATSSETGEGIEALRAEIAQLALGSPGQIG